MCISRFLYTIEISEYGNEKDNVYLPMFLEKTWNMPWCIDLQSWQCPCSWQTNCTRVFGWSYQQNWPIHQTLPHVTFGYSQKWRSLWTVTDFQTSLTLRNTQWPSRAAFHNRGSSNILNNGNTDSLTELQHHGTTLKVTSTISV